MKKPAKRRIGIQFKITIMIMLVSLIVVSLSFTLGYFWASKLLLDVVGQNHLEQARSLAMALSRIITEEVGDVKVFLSSQWWTEVITEHNSNYREMPPDAVKRILLDTDKKWQKAEADGPLLKKYLGSDLSARLQRLVEADKTVAEIFVTDKFGGLVASSERTSDFYQADERWWQEAFAGGKGKVFIDDFSFDESAGVMSLSLAVPVRADNGKVIGVCKTVLSARRSLKTLSDFQIGKTGHAVLIDTDNTIIFHRGMEMKTAKFVSEKDFRDICLRKNTKGWFVVADPHVHKQKMFIACAGVNNPFLINSGLHWEVCIDQEAREVLAPLRRLVFRLVILTVVSIAILLILSYAFARVFVRPIKKLSVGTERIAGGDLDFRVNVNTGDEIEEFANSFNEMAGSLKKTTTSIDKLNKEIAQRKHAEEELKESRVRLQLALTAAEMGTWRWDVVANKDTRDANFNHILGLEAKETTQAVEDFVQHVHLEDRTAVQEAIQRAVRENDVYRAEFRIVRPDGAVRWLSDRGEVFYDEKGQPSYMTGAVVDITERKRAEEQLIALINVKSEFVSMVSHELRTPLTAIKEAVALVSDGTVGAVKAEQKELLELAKRNVDRLARLINDVLDFQKLDSGKLEFHFEENGINNVIKDIERIIAHAAKGKNLKINTELEECLPLVRFDKDKIAQVITNLVGNAVKFTDKGKIAISTNKEGNTVHVAVSDTGLGIKHEDMPKLFQSFAQLGKPRDKRGGTGLGLAISREIITRHGGKIWAESEFGKGSTFHFVLPIVERRG